MLENEPNAGATGPDGETTEQSTTAPRRRASRPAGPPPEVPDAPAPVTVAAAAGTGGQVITSTGEQAGASAPAGSARRRASRPAGSPPPVVESAAPAGSPVEAAVSEAVADAVSEAVAQVTAAAGVADAVAAGAAEGTAEPAAETKPKRATRTRSTATTPRRRTGKKAAEAAEEPAGGGEQAATGAAVQDSGQAVQAAGGTATPDAPAQAVVAQDTAAQVGQAGSLESEQAAEESAAPKRRRTRKKAEPEPVEEQPVAAAEDDDVIDVLPEDEPLDDEPAGEDLDEDLDRPSLLADPFGLSATRRHDEPGAAVQRPAAIFAPLFQAPDPSQATPVAKPVAKPARVEPEPVAEAEEPADETVVEDEDDTADEQDEDESGSRRRRRRRGGRGRGKQRERDEADDSDDQDDDGDEDQAEETQEEEVSSSRRRRRRRRRGSDDGAEPVADDPPNTVVRIRAPRSGRATALDTSADGVQSVRGSTRLEAKKQRRREGRELGRRRPPIITESEFLARRESVDRMMVVRRQGDRTQIAVLEDGVLVEHYVNREASQSYVGNVYLGKVQNVLPSMEAAFVDIGKGRNAVLYAGEVNFDTAGMEGQPKRIESALKSGQSVLVQVTKDPIGHKGARLTSQISLPGRYLVYVPDGSMTGISRKLPDKERTRLKSILKKVMPENAGVIVRTAAEGASEDELARDVARLSAQWENIQRKAKSASPPELLSAEPDLTVRVVRDVFNEDFSSLVVQGEGAWETVDEYVKYVAPHLTDRLSKWDGEQGDVFESYRIDEQLGKAMERKVWLPSGGSLVIDRTEAMTVVDVNTGKFTGQGGNLEETVTRNNLEAAEEIVRQLRLRDIGGIIVIDFIDMVLESNRDLVLRRMLECLARDRTKHQVAEVTSLGLVQMTRKRVGQGLLEAFSTPCECCNGRGLIVSTEPVESKSESRGTQGKMAVEKAVAEKTGDKADKVSAAKDSAGRDTVTGALDDVPAEDDQAGQTSGRGRRRSRRAKSSE
ncbi:Rne/Rng family ribonuclease [Nonomuraea muscovyensis]|uniref:Ribonuclease E n=1 Tax=Nonomuraea muscovyensis TaxID=1124761 RepID=A0A7X0C9Q4_9ACTN|nr:ribonuclease E/G [Nonomuraea muscovyensis]MBB6349706.1 ribonuclease E [Nonomuraea muscovyensis]